MKLFRILTITLLAILFSVNLYAQSMEKDQFASPREARKAARAAHKAAVATENMAMYNNAVMALKQGEFVLEVDQIIFPKGKTKFVSAITNFISMNNGEAVIQIATSNFYPGQNGLGGFTVDGKASNISITTDKNGTVTYNFVDQGSAVSATVNIQLYKDGNRATVTIYPNFNSNNLTLNGKLVPYDQSDVFKGSSI